MKLYGNRSNGASYLDIIFKAALQKLEATQKKATKAVRKAEKK